MKRKKRPLTIIEMMIVITLIGIIAAVLGYNMQGALEKGKAKQTELAIEKVRNILELEYSTDDSATLSRICKEPAKYLRQSGLVKNPNDLLKDGWGEKLQIKHEDGALIVFSNKYNLYKSPNVKPTNAPNSDQKQIASSDSSKL